MSLLLSSNLLSDSSPFCSSDRVYFIDQCSRQAGDVGTVITFAKDLLHSNRQATEDLYGLQSSDALLKKITITSSNLNLPLASAGCWFIPFCPMVLKLSGVIQLLCSAQGRATF